MLFFYKDFLKIIFFQYTSIYKRMELLHGDYFHKEIRELAEFKWHVAFFLFLFFVVYKRGNALFTEIITTTLRRHRNDMYIWIIFWKLNNKIMVQKLKTWRKKFTIRLFWCYTQIIACLWRYLAKNVGE